MTTPTYRAIVELIGEPLAVALVERIGGSRVYVPAHPGASSPLVLAIGHSAAARICDVYAGSDLHIPSRTALAVHRRRDDIHYDLRRGLSAAEVARRHGITVQHVRRIRRQESH